MSLAQHPPNYSPPSRPTLGAALDRVAVLANDLGQLASETQDARAAKAATDTITIAELLHELAELLADLAGVPEVER